MNSPARNRNRLFLFLFGACLASSVSLPASQSLTFLSELPAGGKGDDSHEGPHAVAAGTLASGASPEDRVMWKAGELRGAGEHEEAEALAQRRGNHQGAPAAARGDEPSSPRQGKPNIVVILTDDHGYADLGCQSARGDIRTPHIDKLAANGVRFTHGYTTAPQCIPARAGLLTGRYQQRFGLDANGTIPLPIDETTIPQRLQEAGYRTGMVGKWHLDPNHASRDWIREFMPEAKPGKVVISEELGRRYMPDRRGFTDMFCGHIQTYFANYKLDGSEIALARNLRENGFRIDIQTEAALAFIKRNAKQPFFLYLAYFAPHVPPEAPKQYLDRFPGEMPERRRTALAMISAMDDGVGRIRRSLEQHGLTKNTLLFFISDNGAPLKLDMQDLPLSDKKGAWNGSRNDPWIGEKGMLAEGGVRVPFLMTWPGTVPAGKIYDHPVITLDVGATAIELAGLEKVPALDGVNLIPYLTGKTESPPHEMLFWRIWNQSSVRKGKWKYLQAGDRNYLFDLSSPQHEKVNLIANHPEIAAQLQASLKRWAEDLKKPGLADGPLKGPERAHFNHHLPR